MQGPLPTCIQKALKIKLLRERRSKTSSKWIPIIRKSFCKKLVRPLGNIQIQLRGDQTSATPSRTVRQEQYKKTCSVMLIHISDAPTNGKKFPQKRTTDWPTRHRIESVTKKYWLATINRHSRFSFQIAFILNKGVEAVHFHAAFDSILQFKY